MSTKTRAGLFLELVYLNMQVKRYELDKVLIKGTVERIVPVTEYVEEMEEEGRCIKELETESEVTERKVRKRVKYFQVQLQEGDVLKARQVVIATGPTRAQMANIPSWVKNISESYPEECLQHTVHLMHQLPNYKQKLRETHNQIHKETSPPQGK